MSKQKIKIYLGLAVGIFIVLVIAVAYSFIGSEAEKESIESVSVDQNGEKLVVSRDGSVVFTSSEGVFFDTWSREKTDAFFNYFEDNYTGESQFTSEAQNSVTISKGGNDYTYITDGGEEIFEAGGGDAQNPDDNNNNNDSQETGGSINSTPTPAPTNNYQGGGSSDPECLYWTLSYCVIKRTPLPTATPQPSIDPNANVIDAANCGDYLSGNSAPTIINNTVCLPEPTPAP